MFIFNIINVGYMKPTCSKTSPTRWAAPFNIPFYAGCVEVFCKLSLGGRHHLVARRKRVLCTGQSELAH